MCATLCVLANSGAARSNCYELFGCDVMLDSHLMPHLIEVNISPSLMGKQTNQSVSQ